MARIRTIKPEFWEDDKIGSLSFGARLLFLCCLNLADDTGIVRWNSRYLKSSAFMYDDIKIKEVEKYMSELVDAGIICHYQADGQFLGYVRNFQRHQKINRPQPGKFPLPTKDDLERVSSSDSVNIHGTFTECSLTEKEGKGNIYKEISTKVDTKKDEAVASTPIDVRKKDFYDSLVPFVEKYTKEIIRSFFDYWTEMNKSKTKMRFEQQKTWELEKRLATWKRNEEKWNPQKRAGVGISISQAIGAVQKSQGINIKNLLNGSENNQKAIGR